MIRLNGFVFDVEADDLYFGSTKMWIAHFRDLDTGEKLSVYPEIEGTAMSLHKIHKWLEKYKNPLVIGHNILGYDMFAFRKLLGLEFTVGPDTMFGFPVKFIDTFYMSMFLNPDRQGHGIGPWGERLGLPKIDWRAKAISLGLIRATDPDGAEFKQWHPEMGVYCERDVEVNYKVFIALLEEYVDAYGDWYGDLHKSYICGQKSFFLMSCQGYSGWKFDLPKAEALQVRIQEMMEELRASVEPQLPPRPLKKAEESFYTMPAKPWKLDGTFSSHMEKFIERHNAEIVDRNTLKIDGKFVIIQSKRLLDVKVPMEIGNQDDLKEWFLESGWQPVYWNYKKGPDGKPMRDPGTRELIQTSPKIQEQGKLCPNLEEMEGDLVKQVVKYLSLRNRSAVLKSWIANPRLAMDGRLSTDRTGIAATHRQKHKNVVNVPKASDKVLLGKEFRELFCAEDGFEIAAGDAAALEGRVQGHYCWDFDPVPGTTATELLQGDPHSKNAFAFYSEHSPEILQYDLNDPNFNKDDPGFKPFRDRSKNGLYATMYGCAGPKLAKTLGLPEYFGAELLERFWDANPGTRDLKAAKEKEWMSNGKKYLTGIDGRKLVTRKKSALLNTLFQSCGAIIMDYACWIMDHKLGKIYWDSYGRPFYLYKGKVVRRIGYFHDELEFECELGIGKEIAELIEQAIAAAGRKLGLKLPLAGEGKTGQNWKEVH